VSKLRQDPNLPVELLDFLFCSGDFPIDERKKRWGASFSRGLHVESIYDRCGLATWSAAILWHHQPAWQPNQNK
jgi:hypothetical protein